MVAEENKLLDEQREKEEPDLIDISEGKILLYPCIVIDFVEF